MEQPEGQSEQSGKQPGTDQKMDVEVTQLQTGGDQKLFQGTEAAPVKVGTAQCWIPRQNSSMPD